MALLSTHPAPFHIGNALRLLRWCNFVRAAQSIWIVQLVGFLEKRCRILWGVHFVLVRTITEMFVFSLVMAHYCSDASSSLIASYMRDTRHVLLIMAGGGSESGDSYKDAFAIVLMLTGVLLFAYVIGNISTPITTANYLSRVTYERKKQALVSKMAKLQLPEELQEHVHRCYEHLRTEYDATHEDITDFTKDLTRPLALEVGLCRYMNLVIRVSFWSDCSPDFVSAVVLDLRVRVHLPDDYIVRKGEVGTEFFMTHRGVGELTGYYRETIRVTNGASLGEVALLLNCKRATSVRALTYMEVYILSGIAFQGILARYHDDRRCVILRILPRGLQSNEHPQLWQEVLLQRARKQGERGEFDTKHSLSQAAGELNDQNASDGGGAHSGEMTASEGAEILVDVMDLTMIGNRETTSTPSSVSEAKRLEKHSSQHQQQQQQIASEPVVAGSYRSPTTSLAPTPQDANAEGLDVTRGTDRLEFAQNQQRHEEPRSESNNQVPSEQLELLRSFIVLMTRMEDKLGRVEEIIAQPETQQESQRVIHSDSIGNSLISLTVPSYSATSEDFDTAQGSEEATSSGNAQHIRVRTAAVIDGAIGLRYNHLVPERLRRALSLDLRAKQNLSQLHQQRSALQSSTPPVLL